MRLFDEVDRRWCARVLLRLLRHAIVTEYVCVRPHGHAGEHDFAPIERFRNTETVSVGGGVV